MPGRIRTPGLLVRSQALYPAELRARVQWGINVLNGTVAAPTGFENVTSETVLEFIFTPLFAKGSEDTLLWVVGQSEFLSERAY